MANSNSDPIPVATWPEALPHPDENHFLTVLCERQAQWWCLHSRSHNSSDFDFQAKKHWVSKESLENMPNSWRLRDFLSPFVHEALYGTQEPPVEDSSNDTLATWCTTQRFAAWTVYVLPQDGNSNSNSLRGLRQLFAGIPVRIYQLTWQDFYPNQPHTATLSLDTLAGLYAIWDERLHTTNVRLPIFYFHASDRNLVNYMACDREGKVLGEGMVPGLNQSFAEPMGSLNESRFGQQVLRYFTEEIDTSLLFRPGQQHGEIKTIFQTMLLDLQAIMKEWKRQLDSMQELEPHHIWIDGFHAPMICQLLQTPGQHSQNLPDWRITSKKEPLAHSGIEAVLHKQMLRSEQPPALALELVGQRVVMGQQDEPRLGTITSYRRGTNQLLDCYMVNYEQGGCEELKLPDLPVALERFHNRPEPSTTTWRREHYQEKRRAAWTARQKILAIPEVLEAKEKAKKLPSPNLEQGPVQQKQAVEVQPHAAQGPSSQQSNLQQPRERAAVDPVETEKRAFQGLRVAKYFDDDLYYGTVDSFFPGEETTDGMDLWHIVYDDGDEEDLVRQDLEGARELYLEFEAEDPLVAARAGNPTQEI